jgi:predicted small lipoprotein YifL
MRRQTKIFSMCLLLVMTLVSCGVKAPLYLPEKKYPQDARLKQPNIASHLLISNAA